MLENAPLERTQLRARLETELGSEPATVRLVGGKRFRLAAGAIEAEHQLPEQTLSKWMLNDEPLELADELCSCPELELGIDAPLECEQAALLQPLGLLGRQGLRLEVGERTPPPEIECPTQLLLRRGRVPRRRCPASLLEQCFELVDVEFARRDTEQVARRVALDAIAADEPAESRNVGIERALGARWCALSPQAVDQPIARDDLISA